MPTFKALINGQSYAWQNIKVNILGVTIIGISAVDYKEAQVVEDTFGAGNRAVSRGYGNITNEGSLTLHMNEIEPLQDVSPNGSLIGIPEFDIVVAYLPDGGKIVTHTLKNCRFKENSRSPKQGDTNIQVEIPLAIGQIIWK